MTGSTTDESDLAQKLGARGGDLEDVLATPAPMMGRPKLRVPTRSGQSAEDPPRSHKENFGAKAWRLHGLRRPHAIDPSHRDDAVHGVSTSRQSPQAPSSPTRFYDCCANGVNIRIATCVAQRQCQVCCVGRVLRHQLPRLLGGIRVLPVRRVRGPPAGPVYERDPVPPEDVEQLPPQVGVEVEAKHVLNDLSAPPNPSSESPPGAL